MSDDPIPSLAEALTVISRLRSKIVGLEATVADNEARVANTHGMAAEISRLRAHILDADANSDEAFRGLRAALAAALAKIERLRAQILELEANSAVILGTLATTAENEPPRVFLRNVPPNAPPHDETP